MKYLILITAIALSACNTREYESPDTGATKFSDNGVPISVRIIEKDGRKFAVASCSHGVSIIELHEKP